MDDVISLGVGEPDFDTPRVDRRGRRREPPRGPDPLHLQLRHARAAARAVGPPRAPLRRPLRPGDRAADHRRRVRGGRPRPARDVRPGRRGHPPRAVVRGVRAGHRLRGRRRPSRRRPGSRTTSRSTRRPSRPPITPRTKALFLGYPCNPTGAVLPRRRPGRAGRDRRPPRPARLQRRDLRPPRVRHVPPPGDERAARDARADDPDGRLLARPTR